MESGAKGCVVIVSGKLRGQRAKSMKFVDGLMVHAGNPTRDYIDKAVTHVLLRQGTITCFSLACVNDITTLPTSCVSSYRSSWYQGKDYASS